jgi:GTP-binding protein HflX
MAEEQAATTHEVLKELNAGNKPIITVLNKMDKAPSPSLIHRLRMTYPKNVQISALTHQGFDELEEVMIQELSRQRKIVEVRIPQSEYSLVSEIMRVGHILSQEYDENDVILRVDVPVPLANKLSPYTS